LPQIIWLTAVLGIATAAAVWLFWPVAVLPIGLWVFGVAFFRDPERVIPQEPGVFVSPADGTVTEVTPTGDGRVRIGIFLSLFNVHVNRAPCDGRVSAVQYRAGRFLNAMNPASSTENESNTISLEDASDVGGPVVVKQVAGLVARRIVCHCREGDRVVRGQRIGMIKFGSRTELVLEQSDSMRVLVGPGDRVRGGSTIVARVNRNGT
jgi:phosphatidylserine decarboxylase